MIRPEIMVKLEVFNTGINVRPRNTVIPYPRVS